MVTKPNDLTAVQVKQLRDLGFSDDVVEVPKRLVMSLSGLEKSGKTHFALTAPPPIIFFNIDIGTEGVVHKFQADGKRVFVYDVRVRRGAQKSAYETLWFELRSRMETAYKLGVGTIVVDTGTEAYELARLAHFGKLTQVLPHHYTEVNAEWRELLRLAYDSTMSTVFVHKMKPKWVNDKRTADYELSGFSEMGYMSQINVTTFREDIADDGGVVTSEFGLLVKDCRQSPDVNGAVMRGPMCNFNILLARVHGK